MSSRPQTLWGRFSTDTNSFRLSARLDFRLDYLDDFLDNDDAHCDSFETTKNRRQYEN